MAAGGHVNADLAVMGTVSGEFKGHFDSLQSAITTLQNESETHAASWNGDTKNAYNGAMDNVTQAWNKLNNLLDLTAGNISTSASNYGGADQSGAADMNKVPTTGITDALHGM